MGHLVAETCHCVIVCRHVWDIVGQHLLLRTLARAKAFASTTVFLTQFLHHALTRQEFSIICCHEFEKPTDA